MIDKPVPVYYPAPPACPVTRLLTVSLSAPPTREPIAIPMRLWMSSPVDRLADELDCFVPKERSWACDLPSRPAPPARTVRRRSRASVVVRPGCHSLRHPAGTPDLHIASRRYQGRLAACTPVVTQPVTPRTSAADTRAVAARQRKSKLTSPIPCGQSTTALCP